MRLGVTGSRYDRHINVCEKLYAVLEDNDISELHHGDCSGWDHQSFSLADALCIKTIAHPPTDDRWRAFTNSTVILPPKPFLDRNKDIVNAVDFLIAAPYGPERQRSGTWSTVRYAKKQGVKGVVWL